MSFVLSKEILKVFSSISVRFIIHVFLLTSLILIGQRYWFNFQQRQEIYNILNENKTLATSNSILKIQKDYLESNFYSEKASKESQWKNIGEKVVDTSNLESRNNNPNEIPNYIPEKTKTQITNPEKWLRYIFWDSVNLD